MLKPPIINAFISSLFFIAIIASLVLWCRQHFKSQEEQSNKRVIEVNFYNPSSYNDFGIPSLKFDSVGTYKRVSFNGIKIQDSATIMEIEDYLKGFNQKMEMVDGLQVVFSDGSKYGDFVKVLDICYKEEIRRFIPYKNTIWIPGSGNLRKCAGY